MALLENFIDMLLPVIAFLAVGALLHPKPSVTARLLFIESIMVAVYFAVTHGFHPVFGGAALLTFFAMTLVGLTLYIETSFTRKIVKSPKFNLALGAILVVIFWRNINSLARPFIERASTVQQSYSLDETFLALIGFSLFAILVSALIIFDIKPPQTGGQK